VSGGCAGEIRPYLWAFRSRTQQIPSPGRRRQSPNFPSSPKLHAPHLISLFLISATAISLAPLHPSCRLFLLTPAPAPLPSVRITPSIAPSPSHALPPCPRHTSTTMLAGSVRRSFPVLGRAQRAAALAPQFTRRSVTTNAATSHADHVPDVSSARRPSLSLLVDWGIASNGTRLACAPIAEARPLITVGLPLHLVRVTRAN